MRISTDMMQRLAVDAILERQADVSNTQQQLATGKKLNRPSDDPLGSARTLRLNQQLVQIKQHQDNADRAISKLEAEEVALEAFGVSLLRVRDLAVQGLNDSMSAADRTMIAAEVRARLDEMLDLANSKDGSEYLFSGFQTKTQPFVETAPGVYSYQGDQGQRNLQISETRQIETSDSGNNIFRDLAYSGGGKQDIFKTVYDFAVALEADAPIGTVLTDVDTALDSIFTVRAEVGARLNTVDSQIDINEQYDIQLQGTISEIEDLDYAEAIGELNLQLAGMQAAQQSFQMIQSLSLFNYL